MELSVIIVSYNTKELTHQAIRSVFADTSVVEKEVIVVDNNSKDGTIDEINKVHPKSSKFDLVVIRNKSNKGFSKANNQGIKVARGKYILLLNSDTKLKKGALKKMINFADENGNVGVVGARLLNADGSLQKSCFNFPTIGRAVKQYWFGKDGGLEKFAPNGKQPVKVDAVVGAAFLITPNALKKVGGLDERYFFFYEDLDYCREVNKVGLDVYYLPSAEVYHYHGASGKKLAKSDDQWRRLIPSSKIYHGTFNHYVFNFVLWSGQKWQRMLRRK